MHLHDPRIQAGIPAVVLAPMEGVTDAPMRAILSELGGFTFCVSEFYRISQDIPKPSAYARHVPELKNGCKTPSGVPIQLQLLGGDAGKMAEAAARACKAGAPAIDLNFGCPAPTVNRHDGGATLLKHPERIREIVHAVRQAVPRAIPVSAKLRLGWESIDDIHHNAEMAAEGGADWITIHGRTKVQGYTPPAYWNPIGQVRKRLAIPVVANGEIWTLDDFRRCRDETGCEHFMLGRSALADPGLARVVAVELGLEVAPPSSPIPWPDLFLKFSNLCLASVSNPNYALARLKQWIKIIGMKNGAPELQALRKTESLNEFFKSLSMVSNEVVSSTAKSP
jgi:tRNA-dihydrouridine synthase C